ncbi:MAG: DNA repair protein RecN [Saprospiraceae bacterium]|nr:DNA repair protein RecN [Saprospiraceae bacterium]
MLHRLLIQNYAIIQRQEITFDAGLSIITGETGAGKSILLGALSLVMGQRADSKVLYDKDRKAIVEATFVEYPDDLHDVLAEHELDQMEQMILRREILPSGKSRAFVNDTPVRLDVMQRLSSRLVDLHQQFESLEIQEATMQYQILDAFAGLTDKVAAYRAMYQTYQALNQKIDRLVEERRQSLQQRDYLTFQLEELNNAAVEPGQLEEWESDYRMLANASEIKGALSEAAGVLDGSDGAVTDRLRAVINTLRPHASDPRLQELTDRLVSLSVEAADLSQELFRQEEAIDPDPGQLATLESRIDTVRRLMMKHGVNTDEELAEVREAFSRQLADWEALGDDLQQTEHERDQTLERLKELAGEISAARHAQGTALSKVVIQLLRDLEMKHAVLNIDITPLDKPGPQGMDHVEFLFSANLGAEQLPIKKVASGGELSRLSLCIKSVVSRKMELPTLIFDEIDTGVSGQVALKMGKLLHDLSEAHQVIMITHSPQIASRAHDHFLVKKSDHQQRSIAEVIRLDQQGRILEIAKMLSGDPPTEAAVLNAKELINV